MRLFRVPGGIETPWKIEKRGIMCLAIPMEIIELKDNNIATVSVTGATRDVALDLTPDAKLGDYVLVHAGFSIQIVSPEDAAETLKVVQEMIEMVDDPLLNPAAAEEMCTLQDHAASVQQPSQSAQIA